MSLKKKSQDCGIYDSLTTRTHPWWNWWMHLMHILKKRGWDLWKITVCALIRQTRRCQTKILKPTEACGLRCATAIHPVAMNNVFQGMKTYASFFWFLYYQTFSLIGLLPRPKPIPSFASILRPSSASLRKITPAHASQLSDFCWQILNPSF